MVKRASAGRRHRVWHELPLRAGDGNAALGLECHPVASEGANEYTPGELLVLILC